MANPKTRPELNWEEHLPEQVNVGDYVVVVDSGGTGNSVIGVVYDTPYVTKPDDTSCLEWLLLIKIHPQDLGVRLVSTDRPVQVLRP